MANEAVIQNFSESSWGGATTLPPVYLPDFLDGKPAGTDNLLSVVTNSRNNMLVLTHAVASGALSGWDLTVTEGTGTTDEPQYVYYKKSALWLRGEITYTSSVWSSIDWEYSANSGGAWDAVGTETVTYDADYSVTSYVWS